MEQNWSGFGHYGDKRYLWSVAPFCIHLFSYSDFDRYYIALDRKDIELMNSELYDTQFFSFRFAKLNYLRLKLYN